MTRGGIRQGAGRPKGSRNQAEIELIAELDECQERLARCNENWVRVLKEVQAGLSRPDVNGPGKDVLRIIMKPPAHPVL